VNDLPPSVLHRRWRPGRNWGKTVVAMGGDDPGIHHEDDELIGVMFSETVARHVCESHNESLERRNHDADS
jgi:hypothetical protein